MKITMTPELQAIIHAAVQEGIAAGKSLSRKERTTIQRTEARLYAIPGLRTRIEDNRAERARPSRLVIADVPDDDVWAAVRDRLLRATS